MEIWPLKRSVCVKSINTDYYSLVTVTVYERYFPYSAWTVLVGRQEGHLACKKLGVGLLVMIF